MAGTTGRGVVTNDPTGRAKEALHGKPLGDVIGPASGYGTTKR